eukprot:643681-Amphidinium_carterae.1
MEAVHGILAADRYFSFGPFGWCAMHFGQQRSKDESNGATPCWLHDYDWCQPPLLLSKWLWPAISRS